MHTPDSAAVHNQGEEVMTSIPSIDPANEIFPIRPVSENNNNVTEEDEFLFSQGTPPQTMFRRLRKMDYAHFLFLN